MVEAAVALPIIILTALLLLRLFTFYLEILNTGVSEHMDALHAQDTGAKVAGTYSHTEEITMLRGGILGIDLSKRIDTRLHLVNEDALARGRRAAG